MKNNNYLTYVDFHYTFAGSKIGKYTNVTVTNCDNSGGDCILKRGSDATISINFTIGEFPLLLFLLFFFFIFPHHGFYYNCREFHMREK